jgi:hypothetical protein
LSACSASSFATTSAWPVPAAMSRGVSPECVRASIRAPCAASRVDHSKITGDTSTETTVDPSILIDYEHGLALVQLELGGAIGRQSSVAASQRSQRYFVGLSYRLGFQP